jgi:uncharacterized membrane protein
MVNKTQSTIKNNAYKVTEYIISRLNVNVTKSTIRYTLNKHVDFPSLLSLSDSLDEWGISNAAIRLDNLSQLQELPTPYIAPSSREKGAYLIVEAINAGKITHYEPVSSLRVTEPIIDFSKHWSGVVLLTEKNEKSGEVEYKANRLKEIVNNIKLIFVVLSLILIALFLLNNIKKNLTEVGWIWLLTKSMGSIISLFLVQKYLGINSNFTNSICNLTGKNNCDSVLNSPGGSIGGYISLSEVGLIYFIGGFIQIIFACWQPNIFYLVNIIAILALPFIIFSLYYQAVILHKWCFLCLSILAVLAAEGVMAIVTITKLSTSFALYYWLITGFLIPICLWIILKPTIKEAINVKYLRQKLDKLQTNYNLFDALLKQQDIAPEWLPNSVISFGDPKSKFSITVALNPFCKPCATIFEVLKKLLHGWISLKVNIIIVACDGNKSNTYKLLKHLISLQIEDKAEDALSDWFLAPKKDYLIWASKWPTNLELISDNEVDQHCIWSKQAQIKATPSVYINGYKLPPQYELENLRPIINNYTYKSKLETLTI